MRTLPALLLILTVTTTAALANAPFPGGVLDSTGRLAYLAGPEGLVAIDLASGDVRWRSDEAAEPLVVVGDRLFALAPTRTGRLFVRGFDLNGRGERVFESEPIELPTWATPENGPGHSFSFTWTRDKAALELSWQVAAWAAGSPRKESAGAAVIDLTTGKVSRKAPPAPAAPAATPAVLERAAVRWHRSEGGRLRAVTSEDQAGTSAFQRKRVLVLRQWDERTGRQGQPVEMLSGSDPLVMPDANGKRLWLRDATPAPDQDTKEGPRWLVVDASNGGQVCRVPLVPGTTPATVHNNRAYCITVSVAKIGRDEPTRKARALVAVDLESGKVLWRRALR